MKFLTGGLIAAMLLFPTWSAAQTPTLPPECKVGTAPNTVTCTITPNPPLAPSAEAKYLITVTDRTGVVRPTTLTVTQSPIIPSPTFDGKTATFTVTDPDGIASVTIAPAP